MTGQAIGATPVTRQWRDGSFLVTSWDRTIKRKPVGLAYGVLAFATDFRLMYRDIAALGDLPAEAAVLDVPCGGGVALSGLSPDRPLRYVGADVSPFMLARARREANRRRLAWVDLDQASVYELPYDDGSFDLCVSYMGLHCFPAPPAAVREMARVVRAGGELRGNTVVLGGSSRSDFMIRVWQRRGIFEQVHAIEDVERWLVDAGLDAVKVERSGAIAHFSGRRPNGDATRP